MRTRSLRLRVTVASSAVIILVMVGFGSFVYLVLQAQLYAGLHQLLAQRFVLTHKLAGTLSPTQLAQRVSGQGVRASVRLGTQAAATSGDLVRVVRLPAARSIVLSVSTADTHRVLRHLLLLETVGGGSAVVLAVLGLRRAVALALAPLDYLMATVREVTGGAFGRRLRPERTDTELGRLAAAFDQMLETMEEALGQARAAEARSGRFLADAAHQLRTPIAGIQASAEALLASQTPRHELLANIARETRRAGQLLATLLRMARLDAGAPLPRERCDVRALVAEEVERAAALAAALTVTVDDGPPVLLNLDAPALHEALAALLDNARRHARARITVVVAKEGDWLAVRISDDGPGLSAGSEQQAFERFVSLDGAGGSGLGLALARDIARSHDGELVYDAPSFVLRLPLAGPGVGVP